MSELELHFTPPVHGWMPVRVRLGSDEAEIDASYVSDVVTALVYAALELTEAREARPVTFYEEPGGYRLGFSGTGEHVQVTLTKHRDRTPVWNERTGDVVLSGRLPRMAVARALWSAIDRVVTATGREAFEAGWQKPFPAKEFAQLAERVG